MSEEQFREIVKLLKSIGNWAFAAVFILLLMLAVQLWKTLPWGS